MASTNEKQPILVPVDFSLHSEVALASAAELADLMGLPLIVLHVVHDLGEAPGYYAVKGRKKHLARMEDVASEMLDECLQKARKRFPKRQALKDAQTKLVVGLPVSRILEVAGKVNARMIVMGSIGRTGLSHMLLGSKAEQVVRTSPIPVMIVKEKP